VTTKVQKYVQVQAENRLMVRLCDAAATIHQWWWKAVPYFYAVWKEGMSVPLRYSLNIVESGIRHHTPNPYTVHLTILIARTTHKQKFHH
jgi:hypothetical protein